MLITDSMTVFSKKDTDDASFLTTRDTLIDLAKQYISSRFSNFNDNSVLKAAASITEPLLWPPRIEQPYLCMEKIT